MTSHPSNFHRSRSSLIDCFGLNKHSQLQLELRSPPAINNNNISTASNNMRRPSVLRSRGACLPASPCRAHALQLRGERVAVLVKSGAGSREVVVLLCCSAAVRHCSDSAVTAVVVLTAQYCLDVTKPCWSFSNLFIETGLDYLLSDCSRLFVLLS